MQTAKEQVAIKEDLLRARYDFYRLNGQMPNTLYIGQVDFFNLCRECESYELRAYEKRPTYMGAWVFRVDADHHIQYICRADDGAKNEKA